MWRLGAQLKAPVCARFPFSFAMQARLPPDSPRNALEMSSILTFALLPALLALFYAC